MEPKKVIDVKESNNEIKNKTEQTEKHAYLFVGACVATMVGAVMYANSDTLSEELLSSAIMATTAGATVYSFSNIVKSVKENKKNNPDIKIIDYIFEEDSPVRTRKK